MAELHGRSAEPRFVFNVLERTTSVLSVMGSLFVITTFTCSKAFHKPINRLVFYATIGNLVTNVATLMATSFVDDPDGAPCQTQAFLIQMFMPADALWMLAMAINVYLTFYFKFDAARLRKMEVPYLVFCYGLPFAVSLTMVFVKTPERGRMFGNANLWCWTSPNWDIFRIVLFYGPVWLTIFLTLFIYIRAGREIYIKHKQLKQFSFSTTHNEPETPARVVPVDDPFISVKTTEVFVTTEVVDSSKPNIDLASPEGASARRMSTERRRSQLSAPQKPPRAAYSVTISSNRHQNLRRGDLDDPIPDVSPTTDVAPDRPNQNPNSGLGRIPTNTSTSATLKPTSTHLTSNNGRHNSTSSSSSSSSSNNNSSTTNPGQVPPPQLTTTTTNASVPLRRRAAYEASNATWSYTKCAILFFTALCVTWIPSSANRVYSIIHGGSTSLALEHVAAFVLPLQGFWNAIIYMVTSWGACRMLWADLRDRLWWRRVERRQVGHHSHHHHHRRGGGGSVGNEMVGIEAREKGHHRMSGAMGSGAGAGAGVGGGSFQHRPTFGGRYGTSMGAGGGMGLGKLYESESMTELAGSSHHSNSSRPGSSESPESVTKA